MRKIFSVMAVLSAAVMFSACATTGVAKNPAQTIVSASTAVEAGLDLQALSALVKRAGNAEELERLLNEANGINNLDLDQDGQVDFLRVEEYTEGNIRGFRFLDALPDGEQEVARIEVDRVPDGTAVVILEGNPAYYGAYSSYRWISPWGDYALFGWMWSARVGLYFSPYYWGYYPTYYHGYNSVPWGAYRGRMQRHGNRWHHPSGMHRYRHNGNRHGGWNRPRGNGNHQRNPRANGAERPAARNGAHSNPSRKPEANRANPANPSRNNGATAPSSRRANQPETRMRKPLNWSEPRRNAPSVARPQSRTGLNQSVRSPQSWQFPPTQARPQSQTRSAGPSVRPPQQRQVQPQRQQARPAQARPSAPSVSRNSSPAPRATSQPQKANSGGNANRR